jgi:rhodanese-related sulfurtransferase
LEEIYMSAAKKRSKKKSQRRSQSKSSNPNWLWIAIATALVLVIGFAGFSFLSRPAEQATAGLPNALTVDEAYAKYEAGTFLLDVRTPEEWEEYHIPGTTLIPLDELPQRVSEVPQGEEVVVVCRSGNRSQQGRDILIDAGFTQVSSMEGGLKAWSSAGYPTVEGAE